jgi:hypothetical protein
MRNDRAGATGRWVPIVVAGVLLSWLVVQNGVLLLMVSWPGMPALVAVVRALLKAGTVLALQLMPAALIAAGTGLLWMAARRRVPAGERGLGDARRV